MSVKSSEVYITNKRIYLKKQKKLKVNIWCWLFMLPAVVLYGMFLGYPILASMFYSTLNWSGMTVNATFIGLDNFKELFRDKYFFNAVINSFKYMLLCIPPMLVLSLILAYILNSVIKKGVTFLRTVFFLPVIATSSIIGVVMMFIFGGTGSINQFIGMLGLKSVNWLGNADTAMLVVVMVGVWKDVGTYMIYWLAALQSVSQDLYEAAEIDGANKWQTFSKIVFPLILPMGGVIALLSVISSLKIFDLIQTMTNGGPFYGTDVAATFVYRTAYSGATGATRLGYASAAAVTFGLIVVAIGATGNVVKDMLGKKREV